MNLKEIYLKYTEKFKEKIKEECIDNLFNIERERRITLKTEYTKSNQEPEALTSDIIKEMLRECGIDPLEIDREIVLIGKDKGVKKIVKRKPDFYIKSQNEDLNRHLLFEIEALNKDLEKEGDGEGIEQANEWYNIRKPLYLQYNTIITNFADWFILYYDNKKEMLEVKKLEPWDALEQIENVKFSKGREYTLTQEIHKREITNKFYNEFRDRLNKLIQKPSNIPIDIEIRNYKKPEDKSDEDHQQDLVDYYRTIFSRLLFIKILESWKLLPIDPLSEIIFKADKRHWSSDINLLFFDVFNKKPKDRPREIPSKFKILPYLNGGLFRPSGIEIDNSGNLRDVHLNSNAIKDIWDFFGEYKFIEEILLENSNNSNTINPEILGYIFERSIGEERKKTGSYYTPEEITVYITENTIFPHVIEKINKFLENFKIKKIKSLPEIDFLENSIEVYEYMMNNVLKDIRICDPACGSGAFLKKAADKLLYLYKKCYKGCGRILPYRSERNSMDQMPFPDIYSIKEHILQHNLFGVDLNPSAVEICELRLWLWVIKPPTDILNLYETFECPPLPNIEYNIRSGNSLIGYIKIPKRLDRSDRIDNIWFLDTLKAKESLINEYYTKTLKKEDIELKQMRNEINKITNQYQQKLNKTLIMDYRKELEIDMPIPPIKISNYIKNQNIEIEKLKSEIKKLNETYKLTNFKIKCKHTFDVTSKEIRNIKGISCSVKKTSNKVSSIYPTSDFDINYYSEKREEKKNRLSEFIITLFSEKNWKDVRDIKFERKVNITDLEILKPFHWFMQFSEVFKEEGFDIVVGNPPYGGNIKSIELETNKKIDISKPNIAKLFIIRSIDLIKNYGYVSLLAPKSLTYASDWANLRKFLIQDLIELYDIKEAFKDVLLEQIFYISKDKSNQVYYLAKDFYSNEEKFSINKNLLVDTLLCDILEKDFSVISKIKKEKLLTDLIKTFRGLPLQSFITKIGGERLLEGRNIGLYELKSPFRVFDLNNIKSDDLKRKSKKLKEELTTYNRAKLVFQNIVAFIKNPTPHIKIMGTYDVEGMIPSDTVNIIEPLENTNESFILGLLNSLFFSWLVHRLSYNKAVRTMHFDNYALSKIPIPKLNPHIAKNIENHVKNILRDGFNINIYMIIEELVLKLYSLNLKDMPDDYNTLFNWTKNKEI